jgi:hypothetical protein
LRATSTGRVHRVAPGRGHIVFVIVGLAYGKRRTAATPALTASRALRMLGP